MQYAGAGFTPQYAAGATTAYTAGQYAQVCSLWKNTAEEFFPYKNFL